MSRFLILPLLVCLAMTQAASAERVVKIFLLAGQSNMDGCGLWKDLTPEMRKTPENVKLWDNRDKTGEPYLPVVMGRISSSLLKKTPWIFDHARLVQQAQEDVAAADEHTFLIDTDKLTTLKDNTHFDSEAQLTLGDGMAARMIEALVKEKP